MRSQLPRSNNQPQVPHASTAKLTDNTCLTTSTGEIATAECPPVVPAPKCCRRVYTLAQSCCERSHDEKDCDGASTALPTFGGQRAAELGPAAPVHASARSERLTTAPGGVDGSGADGLLSENALEEIGRGQMQRALPLPPPRPVVRARQLLVSLSLPFAAFFTALTVLRSLPFALTELLRYQQAFEVLEDRRGSEVVESEVEQLMLIVGWAAVYIQRAVRGHALRSQVMEDPK